MRMSCGLLDFCKNNETKRLYIYGGGHRREASVISCLLDNHIDIAGVIENSITNQYPVIAWEELDADISAIVLVCGHKEYNRIIPIIASKGIVKIYFLGGEDYKMLQHYNGFYFAEKQDVDKVYFDRKMSYTGAIKIFTFLKQYIDIKSAIEYGCGCGSWLKALKDIDDKTEVLGIDNSDVDRTEYLTETEFVKCDLTKYKPAKRYDIAITIEVAEHLDEEYAEYFIDNLCASADVIVFSAAIKYQGGDHHVNEQFQSYWCDKFQKRGYMAVDCIRPQFWADKEMSVYYRQNCILYVKDKQLKDKIQFDNNMFDMVHPYLLSMKWNSILNGTF